MWLWRPLDWRNKERDEILQTSTRIASNESPKMDLSQLTMQLELSIRTCFTVKRGSQCSHNGGGSCQKVNTIQRCVKGPLHGAIYRQSDHSEKLLQIYLIKHMPPHDAIDLSELLIPPSCSNHISLTWIRNY